MVHGNVTGDSLLAFLLIFPNGYRPFFWIARNVWSRLVLLVMGFRIKKTLKTTLDPKMSYLLVANHSSYIDIMLMFAAAPKPFVFVGKKELVKIPFFGYLYKRAAIMVDRSSSKSRYGVYGRAKKVLDQGYSVCIFPEKDYVDDSILLNPFKKGAFSSRGHLALAGKSSLLIKFSFIFSIPTQAIIAALSLHKFIGGNIGLKF